MTSAIKAIVFLASFLKVEKNVCHEKIRTLFLLKEGYLHGSMGTTWVCIILLVWKNVYPWHVYTLRVCSEMTRLHMYLYGNLTKSWLFLKRRLRKDIIHQLRIIIGSLTLRVISGSLLYANFKKSKSFTFCSYEIRKVYVNITFMNEVKEFSSLNWWLDILF